MEIFANEELKNDNKIGVGYQILITILKHLERITQIVLNKYLEDVDFCEYLELN